MSQPAKTTNTVDRLFLELSQFSTEKTDRELALEKRIAVLEDAARPIVDSLEAVGEATDWKCGDETNRVYAWYEIEPLKAALNPEAKTDEPWVHGYTFSALVHAIRHKCTVSFSRQTLPGGHDLLVKIFRGDIKEHFRVKLYRAAKDDRTFGRMIAKLTDKVEERVREKFG